MAPLGELDACCEWRSLPFDGFTPFNQDYMPAAFAAGKQAPEWPVGLARSQRRTNQFSRRAFRLALPPSKKISELAECLFRELLAYSRHETRIIIVRPARRISLSFVAPCSFVAGD